LEVSSPGSSGRALASALGQFVGRDVNVKLAGMGRVRARIVAVPSEGTVVLQPQGGPERTFRLDEVRDARLAMNED